MSTTSKPAAARAAKIRLTDYRLVDEACDGRRVAGVRPRPGSVSVGVTRPTAAGPRALSKSKTLLLDADTGALSTAAPTFGLVIVAAMRKTRAIVVTTPAPTPIHVRFFRDRRGRTALGVMTPAIVDALAGWATIP